MKSRKLQAHIQPQFFLFFLAGDCNSKPIDILATYTSFGLYKLWYIVQYKVPGTTVTESFVGENEEEILGAQRMANQF